MPNLRIVRVMGQATATRLDHIWGTAPTTVTTRKIRLPLSVAADHFGYEPGGIVAPKGTPRFEHSERTLKVCLTALPASLKK